MRRPLRLGLAVLALLPIVAAGAYTAFWFIAAGRIADGVGLWARSLQEHDLDLSWHNMGVGGFPLAFRLELADVAVRDRRPDRPGEVLAPVLTASAAPWNFHVWRLDAPHGLRASLGAPSAPIAKLVAQTATGNIVAAPDGGATLWFEAERLSLDAAMRLSAQQALLWLLLPERPAQSHTEPSLGVALDVRRLTLPVVPPPFHNPLDEVSFGITVMGPIPEGPPREAAAAWRDAGGTVELDRFSARWGALTVAGSGTAALDDRLQPIAALSGGVEGYRELMAALAAAGRIRQGDAQLADMALGFLAKRGPDGRPQIPTSFTIQDGEMRLGPLKLGPAPHIDWE